MRILTPTSITKSGGTTGSELPLHPHLRGSVAHLDLLENLSETSSRAFFKMLLQGDQLLVTRYGPKYDKSMDWFQGKFTGKPHI